MTNPFPESNLGPPSPLIADSDLKLTQQEQFQMKAIYKKLDRRIIPCLWFLYFLAAAARSTVGLALTMNTNAKHSLSQNLGLSTHQTSIGLAIFYIGYIIFEVPSNLLMLKMKPQVYISRIQCSIGIISACHAALNGAWSFYFLRALLGFAEAGVWPSMTYYLTIWYPPKMIAHRIGYYFTAAQLSAAVVGLVSAGFQEMDGALGIVGYKWMFLIYGIIIFVNGVSLLWWLPDRPMYQKSGSKSTFLDRYIPSMPVLTPEEEVLHARVTGPRSRHWNLDELWRITIDIRVWPIVVMYIGVVGVGIGIQSYGTLIIQAINPKFSSIDLSLLFAPIWIADAIGILVITPLSDRYRNRLLFFCGPCVIIITGLLITTYAHISSARYAGLLIVGFGLGPTVPICMTWAAEIFSVHYGGLGVAAAVALVTGPGNLGSVITTYALYSGWKADIAREYKGSNLVCVGLIVASISAACSEWLLVRNRKNKPSKV
ncbi:Vitamin H transporter 1 [Neolecta irregularis DAH-3]|uniref:Vitamin H transporter 1 n=1 Tax=Neolecta irregularis (strain DAH-3) TaxID=1198029 RepID=A0A1U7LL22_NEOID|nr:Vitamin H transporter 1 [Neolecta irregularis DAH-3]|eukprot:OLL23338.1 Vitamin H transporter 1 [Neolecta irregularis DAH-3]